MSDGLRIDGTWPSPVALSSGWAKAVGRPWNDEDPDASIRLLRGGHSFLVKAAGLVQHLAGGDVYSPALLRSATRVWVRAGFTPHEELVIMERSLRLPIEAGSRTITTTDEVDPLLLAGIDEKAFEGFWRIGSLGLSEAMKATPACGVVLAINDGKPVGYAIVGLQTGHSYLQRIAVIPAYEGLGYGSSLLSASMTWARQRGSAAMMLNTSPANHRAIHLYTRHGFATSSSRLHVLRFDN